MPTPDRSPDYALSSEQRQRWTKSLQPRVRPRGTRTRIAESLHAAKVGELNTCKNLVGDFVKGKPDALKSIFGHDKRLAVVAKGLELSVLELRQHLEIARGQGDDDPNRYYVPGFEDLGAFDIVDSLFSPPAGQKVVVSGGAVVNATDGSAWTLDSLFDLTTSDDPQLPPAVFIIGAEGELRDNCLVWLRAKLEREEIGVIDWRRADLRVGEVVVQPGLDGMSRRDQTRLLECIASHQLVLVASTSESSDAREQYPNRIELRLGSGSWVWAMQFLDHLRSLLEASDHVADFEAVKVWLEDDPRAGWVVESAETLGLVARHVFDGGELPFSNRLFIERALQRAERLLRLRGRQGDAMLVAVCGLRSLGSVAALACRRGLSWIPIEDVAVCFADEAEQRAGRSTWRELGAPGVLGTIDGLMEIGLFERRDSRVRCGRSQLLVAALGWHIANHLDDELAIRAAVLDPRWHPGLLAAVEFCEDPIPIIHAIERQSPGVRCMTAAAMIWVLGSGHTPSDVASFSDTFLRTLRWWAQRPQAPMSRVLSLGRQLSRPRSPVPVRVGGREPLIVLGQISRSLSDVMPVRWTAEDLREYEVDDATRLLDELHSPTLLDETTARLALMIGAPLHSTEIESVDLWDLLPRENDTPDSMPRLAREDYLLWWRTVAAPCLRATARGTALIAGTIPGMTIRSCMGQNERGTALWIDALYTCLVNDPDNAMCSLVEAVTCYATIGGRWNLEGLDSLWHRLPEMKRSVVRPAIAAALCAGDPWRVDERGTTWLMQTFLRAEDVRGRWSRWPELEASEALYWPWRSFLDAGIDANDVLDWALTTVSSQPTSVVEPRYEPGSNFVAAQLHNVEESPQRAALRHLVEIGDSTLLAVVVTRGPDDLANQAANRLGLEQDARAALLLACEDPRVSAERRNHLLANIHPRPGEFERWSRFVELSANTFEQAARKCQADCAREHDRGRWRWVGETLDLLESLCARPEAHRGLFEEASDRKLSDAELGEAARHICRQFLTHVGYLLARTATEIDERAPVVSRVLSSPALRAYVLGGQHASWWQMACDLHGEEFALACIRAGHADGQDVTRIRLGTISVSEAGIWSTIELDEIGPAVVQRFMQELEQGRTRPSLDLAIENLTRPQTNLHLDAVQDLVACYVRAWDRDAITRVRDVLVQRRHASEDASEFWRGVARSLPTPTTLALVIDELVSLGALSP